MDCSLPGSSLHGTLQARILGGLHFLLQGLFPTQGLDTHLLEKRASEDEMAGWHHRCNGFELGKTAGDSEGQGGLACCSPWGHKESDTTGWLNNNFHTAGGFLTTELPGSPESLVPYRKNETPVPQGGVHIF